MQPREDNAGQLENTVREGRWTWEGGGGGGGGGGYTQSTTDVTCIRACSRSHPYNTHTRIWYIPVFPQHLLCRVTHPVSFPWAKNVTVDHTQTTPTSFGCIPGGNTDLYTHTHVRRLTSLTAVFFILEAIASISLRREGEK